MITLHRSWIIDYRAVTIHFCDNINSLQTAEKYFTYVVGRFGNKMGMSPYLSPDTKFSHQDKVKQAVNFL